MGFWFKSRYRYIFLLFLSLPVLLIFLKMRAGKYDLAFTLALACVYLFQQVSAIFPFEVQSIQISSYVFSSWALHYIFIYLIIIILAQLFLNWIK